MYITGTRRQLLGITIATAVGAAFFRQPQAAEAVDLLPYINPDTASNRGVRFSGGPKEAAGAKLKREEKLKERVARLRGQGVESKEAKQ